MLSSHRSLNAATAFGRFSGNGSKSFFKKSPAL